MSRPLLSRRLKQLIDTGVITRTTATAAPAFALTSAGRALTPVIDHLGRWGRQWRPPPRSGDVHPALLLNDICRGMDRARLPRSPVVVHVKFSESPPPRWWWLTLSTNQAIASATDPRAAEAVRIDCTLTSLARVWLGHTSWLDVLRDRTVRFTGTRGAVRAAIGWLGHNRFTPEIPPSPVAAETRLSLP